MCEWELCTLRYLVLCPLGVLMWATDVNYASWGNCLCSAQFEYNVALRLQRPYDPLSPFLIGRTFLREPSWKYSAKLYSGSKNLRSTCSGNIRPNRRSLPLIGWEQSGSPVNGEQTKIKMDDGVARFFTRFEGNLFICWLVLTCGRRSLVSENPEWDSS